jgi:ring-1,2-phenylacetyl-CoA epoxidase subunit PaaC
MADPQHKFHLWSYLLHLADNSLVLGQRNAEWTGHGPVLEQDIAITNISLDLIGQARNFYQYAAKVYNEMDADEKDLASRLIPRLWTSFERSLEEDDLAFLRDENQFLNLQLNELPRGDWAYSILRQFFFSSFQFFQLRALESSVDTELAAIAEKSLKETSYHLRWSGEWVIRLGDGTEESHSRIQKAMGDLWMFTGEMFEPAVYETASSMNGIAADPESLKDKWLEKVRSVFEQANLEVPNQTWHQSGGKQGRHTEYMGFLLAEMQTLQRAYPNSTW